MANICFAMTVTAECPFHCADENSLQLLRQPVLLGPLDQRSLLSIPLTAVFVYRQETSSAEDLIPFNRLQRALEHLLDYYPHLTGRIVIDPKDQSPQIEQLGAGAKLVSAQCSEPLKSFEIVTDDDKPGSSPRLIGTSLPDGGNALLPPFDPTEAGATLDPNLTVQHTRFACGGVSIGLRLRHFFCDAAGFFQLARDLAELYRGFRDVDNDQLTVVKLSSPPEIHSYLSGLHMSPEERQEALQFSSMVFELAPKIQTPSTSDLAEGPKNPQPVNGCILRFSSNELAAIKAEGNVGNNGRSLSTFCALTAHIWQSIYRARVQLCKFQGLTSTEAALKVPRQLLASLGLRSRGQLDISSRYSPTACYVQYSRCQLPGYWMRHYPTLRSKFMTEFGP